MPLLRDGKTIGSFSLCRDQVSPFTDKQIELVTVFADQASGANWSADVAIGSSRHHHAIPARPLRLKRGHQTRGSRVSSPSSWSRSNPERPLAGILVGVAHP